MERGIYVDKHVPKAYVNKHKELKNRMKNLRALFDNKIHAQIIFEGPLIVLRYREKDQGGTKHSYIIEDSWFPPPNEIAALTDHTPRFDPKLKTTTPLDLSEPNRSILISKIKYKGDDLQKKFEEFLEKDEYRDRVERVEVQKKFSRMIVFCVDWKSCKYLVDKYNKKVFLDSALNMELFSKKDPANKTPTEQPK